MDEPVPNIKNVFFDIAGLDELNLRVAVTEPCPVWCDHGNCVPLLAAIHFLDRIESAVGEGGAIRKTDLQIVEQIAVRFKPLEEKAVLLKVRAAEYFDA